MRIIARILLFMLVSMLPGCLYSQQHGPHSQQWESTTAVIKVSGEGYKSWSCGFPYAGLVMATGHLGVLVDKDIDNAEVTINGRDYSVLEVTIGKEDDWCLLRLNEPIEDSDRVFPIVPQGVMYVIPWDEERSELASPIACKLLPASIAEKDWPQPKEKETGGAQQRSRVPVCNTFGVSFWFEAETDIEPGMSGSRVVSFDPELGEWVTIGMVVGHRPDHPRYLLVLPFREVWQELQDKCNE